ncbi:MAG: ATP-binding cassette domain-containing protein [Verrucomicrobiota bacterium]|nr:ATP-binding cassette domain-containing protein [Verrucomicrobiota bacterium]
MPFLELVDVHTYFPVRKGVFGGVTDTVRAVNGVSLSLEKGEILGLVGESGCGKSTLSRTIMHLQQANSGQIILEGEDLSSLASRDIQRMRLDFQMVFQDPYASLNPRMTVYSILAEALYQRPLRGQFGPTRDLRDFKNELPHRVAELMQRVGLDARYMRKYPHEFSGGQRQRIAIARALAPEPKLILADEPVSALDVSIQSQILNLLLELREDLDLTMIFISHDLSVVRYLADNIAVMNSGKIVEYGPAEKVFNDPQDAYTRKLLEAIPRIQLSA